MPSVSLQEEVHRFVGDIAAADSRSETSSISKHQRGISYKHGKLHPSRWRHSQGTSWEGKTTNLATVQNFTSSGPRRQPNVSTPEYDVDLLAELFWLRIHVYPWAIISDYSI